MTREVKEGRGRLERVTREGEEERGNSDERGRRERKRERVNKIGLKWKKRGAGGRERGRLWYDLRLLGLSIKNPCTQWLRLRTSNHGVGGSSLTLGINDLLG